MDKQKNFNDFTNQIQNIILKLSLTDGVGIRVVGSMNQAYQLYASDFDLMEDIEINHHLSYYKKKFQNIVKFFSKNKNTIVGDIKSGEIEQWKILNDDIYIKNNKVYNYNPSEIIARIEHLYKNGIINKEDYDHSISLIKNTINIDDLFMMKDFFKFHIIRWTSQEVIQGYKILRNNQKFSLEDGFKSGLTKIDLVIWIDKKFVEFSIIYIFTNNGIPLNANPQESFEDNIKNDILKYLLDKNYFKMSKRLFSLVSYYGDEDTANILETMFNSDLGNIYLVLSDVKTLIYLLENSQTLPVKKIRSEINDFKYRLSNVNLPYSTSKKNIVIKILKYLTNLKNKINLADLVAIKTFLENLLSKETKVYLLNYNLFPLKKIYLP
jgi:hypothetical protein